MGRGAFLFSSVAVLASTFAACSAPPVGEDVDAETTQSGVRALDHRVGSGLAMGVVTGRHYRWLAEDADERMKDLQELGVRIIRINIETRQREKRGKWVDEYEPIVRAARKAGIDVLAHIGWNTLVCGGEDGGLRCREDGMPPDPMTLSDEEFAGGFVDSVKDAMDRVNDFLPDVRYIEVWNEPDVYWFVPMHHWPDCSVTKAAQRHGVMMSRVYSHVVARRERRGTEWPKVLGFDMARQDDTCLREVVFEAPAIAEYRATHEGRLPIDILSMHAYGNRTGNAHAVAPWDRGYTFAGGTFADGVDDFLRARFRDGSPIVRSDLPVWYTELGFGLNWAPDPNDEPAAQDWQARTLEHSYAVLRARPQVTAAFWYDYFDDPPESEEGNRHGLRDALPARKRHRSYAAFQRASVAAGDVTPPAGDFTVERIDPHEIRISGWARDADREDAKISVRIDGSKVASARCDASKFSVDVPLAASGEHDVEVVARDSAGNGRVIGKHHLGAQ